MATELVTAAVHADDTGSMFSHSGCGTISALSSPSTVGDHGSSYRKTAGAGLSNGCIFGVYSKFGQ